MSFRCLFATPPGICQPKTVVNEFDSTYYSKLLPMAGRPKNPNETATLTISTTVVVRGLLEDLTKTGVFGKTAAEVAARLVEDQIRVLQKDGIYIRHERDPR
jgi:hypothetical protein